MPPRIYRLSRKSFLQVKSSGRNLSFPSISLLISKRTGLNSGDQNRYSVVTSAKLARKAVQRNRLRRILYHEIAEIIPDQGLDIIIYPKPACLRLSHAQITALIHSLLPEIPIT